MFWNIPPGRTEQVQLQYAVDDSASAVAARAEAFAIAHRLNRLLFHRLLAVSIGFVLILPF